MLSLLNVFTFTTLQLGRLSNAQSATAASDPLDDGLVAASTSLSVTSSPESVEINGTPTTFRPLFTVPSAADAGATLIPNNQDPKGINAQALCPGYNATNVVRNPLGLTAILILGGKACNVYGNDIETLNLTVEYQAADRLSVRVTPAVIDASNTTQYIIPDNIVHQPTADADANSTSLTSDLCFVWSNDPSFSFSVYRVSTGDMLFSTAGTKLVFEDQFVEFASNLPENYNIYVLGETIHGLRLGNNFTKTIYAADVGDPIDE